MSKFRFDKVLSVMPAQKYRAMARMAIETQKYFAASFGAQGLGGQKWAEVQRRKEGTVAWLRATPWLRRAPILYNEGNLFDKTAQSLKKLDATQFTLINPLIYAERLNEGDSSANLPARPFMKQTPQLTKIQLGILKEETGRSWAQY